MKRPTCAVALLSALTLSNCHEENVIRKETRLDYYIESFDVDGLGFDPQLKVVYEYGESGRIHKYTAFGYNPATETMEPQRYFVFHYSGDKVDHIAGYLAGADTPYIENAYQYLPNGEVSTITEDNHAAGVNSTASFTYLENATVKVSYTFSNGGAFDYEFVYSGGNILSDTTTRGSQLCSNGQYTYDQHHNPFRDLGYVDYLLTNLSVNNRLTENVDFVGCAFPSLIPESYTYEYNEQGYPVTATTVYRSGDPATKSRKEFFYKPA